MTTIKCSGSEVQHTENRVLRSAESTFSYSDDGLFCGCSDISVYFVQRHHQVTARIQPNSLPPTPAATKYPSLRVYQQVVEWQSDAPSVPPEEWGWNAKDGADYDRHSSGSSIHT